MAYNKNSWQDGDIITAEKLNHMEDGIEAAGGLTNDVKTALLQIAEKVAYIDEHGQDYYDDLYDALYPSASLVSISAVYTQSGTVYPTTSLSALKDDLVVTAYYDDTSSEAVPAADYMLSGALTVGTSVITASYNGKTATFNVTVSAAPTLSSISAVYTQSGTVYDTDTLDSLKADLVVTATYSDSSTATVPSADYTLSGTLTAGTSTITVTYSGKTTTFNVTVKKAILANGSFTGDIFNYEISKTGHVKITRKNAQTNQCGINLYSGVSGISSDATTPINNQPTLFTLPSGSEVTLAISNVTNTKNIKFAVSIRQANASTSVTPSFTNGSATHTAGSSITNTMPSSVDASCIFVFIDGVSAADATAQNSGVIEFDISLTIDGTDII